MPSERVQRQIDRLLDEAEQAIRDNDWPLVRSRCAQVLRLDPGNVDAAEYLAAAEREPSPRQVASSSSPLPEGEGQGEGQAEDQYPPERPLAGAGGSPALPGPTTPRSVGARFIAPAALPGQEVPG
jgi:hypothetical protein